MRTFFRLTFSICSLLLISCSNEDLPEELTENIIEPVNAIDQKDRQFGVNISEGSLSFPDAFQLVQNIGTNAIELNIPWNEIEKEKGIYTDPSGLLAASSFYGSNNIKVSFSIAVINTVRWEVPAYLDGLPANDPQFINAFNSMLNWFIDEAPENVDIVGISVGNEVDLVLEGQEQWDQYIDFFKEVKNYADLKYPTIDFGVKTTIMHGLFGADRKYIEELNQHADVVMLNYYPNDENSMVLDPQQVVADFNSITSIFNGKRIFINEIGYQSGSIYNGSSEEKQAQFFQYAFSAWDQHSDQIELMIVNWLHDQSSETIEEWKRYYGDTPGLVEFLSTLGLRNYDNTDKKAWLQLKAELAARKWSND